MSSRDNNLDELLREMPLREDGGEEPGEQQAERPDIEALSEMTEEEIDRLLAAGAESAGDEIGSESQGLLQSEEPSREDVLDILEGTGDRDLREIQDLLKKSDRKENIEGEDPGSENAGRDGDPVDRLLADIDGAGENEVATDAVDGRRRRTLKKEQKKAQKEEKKRAKQAAKAAKAAKGKAFLCMDFMAVGVFQACGLGRKALLFAILRKIVLEIPALYLLNYLFPLYGLAYAQFAAELILAAAAVIVLIRLFRGLEKKYGISRDA